MDRKCFVRVDDEGNDKIKAKVSLKVLWLYYL